MPTKARTTLTHACHTYWLPQSLHPRRQQRSAAVGRAPGMAAETPTCLSQRKQGPCEWAWRTLWLEKSWMGNPTCGYEWLQKQGIIPKLGYVFSFTGNHWKTHLPCTATLGSSCCWSTSFAVTPFFSPSQSLAQASVPLHAKVSVHLHKELLLYLKLTILMLIIFWGRFVSYLKYKWGSFPLLSRE